jgi:hypothetical protein
MQWRWAAFSLALACLMYYVQLQTFPDSAHIEFPRSAPVNHWEQGFLWIRDHTPANAIFALDAHYIFSAGEDTQNFTAIAERAALPDYAKDGGIASIVPSLAAEWQQAQAIQNHLNDLTDAERLQRLQPTPVNWIVLSQNAKTGFACPYANDAMKVCRLPHR